MVWFVSFSVYKVLDKTVEVYFFVFIYDVS